jgi:hypothetical protein
MVARCENSNCVGFINYGGRGITIDPKLRTFEGFYAVLGDRPLGLTLDRIDNNKGYSAENVRWADRKTQMRNKRSNRFVTYQGKTQLLIDWSEQVGISRLCIFKRLQRGWPVAKTLSTPASTLRLRKRSAA